MNYSGPHYMRMFAKQGLFEPDFFEVRKVKALGIEIRVPKPVLQVVPGSVEPSYNVGTRRNGIDSPPCPEDLTTEVVDRVAASLASMSCRCWGRTYYYVPLYPSGIHT